MCSSLAVALVTLRVTALSYGEHQKVCSQTNTPYAAAVSNPDHYELPTGWPKADLGMAKDQLSQKVVELTEQIHDVRGHDHVDHVSLQVSTERGNKYNQKYMDEGSAVQELSKDVESLTMALAHAMAALKTRPARNAPGPPDDSSDDSSEETIAIPLLVATPTIELATSAAHARPRPLAPGTAHSSR
jgi:hypothetical protein